MFLACEKHIFRLLNYNLSFKTPLSYLYSFLEKGIFREEDFKALKVNNSHKFINIVEEMALEIIDSSLDHYELYSFTALAVGSSVVSCVRQLLCCKSVWPLWMQNQTGYEWENIEQCVSFILKRYVYAENKLSEFFKGLNDVFDSEEFSH